MTAATDTAHRGREADSPQRIPAKGWKDVLLRVKDQVAENHLSIIAAGVAFYLLLSMVPALAAPVAASAVESFRRATAPGSPGPRAGQRMRSRTRSPSRRVGGG